MWVHSLLRLLLRALVSTPSLLSSNWLAAFVSLVIFAVPQVAGWSKHKWELQYIREHWSANLRLGTITVLCAWLLLFAVSVGKSVYADHQSLIQRIQGLALQNTQLRSANSGLVDPRSRDARIKGLVAEIGEYKRQQSPAIHVFVVPGGGSRPGAPLMQYLLTTGTIRTPVNLLVSCDFPISDAFEAPLVEGGGFSFSSSKRRVSANQFAFNILLPAWSPTSPLWVTIYFEKPVDRMPSCKFAAQ